MTIGIFILVLAAAFSHALWNFAARKVAGNLAVLWLALCAACVMFFPVVVVTVALHDLHSLAEPSAVWFVIATAVIHAFYFAFLSRAYEYGEISVVYPIARGSGIGLTAPVAWIVLHEDISPPGFGGIFLILIGVIALGINVARHSDRVKATGLPSMWDCQ